MENLQKSNSLSEYEIKFGPEWAEDIDDVEVLLKEAESRGYIMAVRPVPEKLFSDDSGELRIELRNGCEVFLATEDPRGFPQWIIERLRAFLSDKSNEQRVMVLGSYLSDTKGHVVGRFCDDLVTFLGAVDPESGPEPPDYTSHMLNTIGLPTPKISFTASPGSDYVSMLKQELEDIEDGYALLLTFFDHKDEFRGHAMIQSRRSDN